MASVRCPATANLLVHADVLILHLHLSHRQGSGHCLRGTSCAGRWHTSGRSWRWKHNVPGAGTEGVKRSRGEEGEPHTEQFPLQSNQINTILGELSILSPFGILYFCRA